MTRDPSADARALLDHFATATGLEGDAPERRYLWTDAFAVCTWLGLGEIDRATALVDRVHRVLGRHRPDDPRDGWISGLPEGAGAERPTAGGLRIGKPLPERSTTEPYDPRLEWERDGQYFHYLTRWMVALSAVGGATGDDRYHRWAVELGQVAYDRFSHGIGPVPNRLYWKMSIDLTRPLVPAMGQHDPLDGYVVLSGIAAEAGGGELADAVDGLRGMAEGAEWATDDPLGTGSLLADAWFLARRRERDGRVLDRVLAAAVASLRDVRDAGFLELVAGQRLAFRELGLAIGLAAVERLAARGPTRSGAGEKRVDELRTAIPLRDRILEFWLSPANRRVPTWREHADINTVMLATALAPEGYLDAS